MEENKAKLSRAKKKEVQSRLGRKPVAIPDGVKVAINDAQVNVEGKRGKLSWTLPSIIGAKVEEKQISVFPKETGSKSKAFHGLSRKLILNMVDGVTKGFEKKVVIEGVGFRAQVSGDKLTMTLGFSHPAVYHIPKGIKVVPDPKQANLLTIEGNDKQLVGQVAAEIRGVRPPEPYKGTGIRYVDEVVHRKAGKAAVGAAGGKK